MTVVNVEIVTNSGAFVRKSDQNLMLKRGFANAGAFWHRNYRTRHFERGAFQRYKYRPRSRRYSKRKQKNVGHQNPLVLTGTSMAATATAQITTTKNGVRIVSPAGKLGFRPRGWSTRLADEYTQINEQEHGMLSKRMNDELVRRLQTYQHTGRIRIR